MSTLIWYIVITAAMLILAAAFHFSQRANGMLPGCLRWEESYYGRHAATQPRMAPPRLTWRQRAARRLRYAALGAWDFIRIRELRAPVAASAPGDGAAPANPSAGAVPLDIRATSSDGFPAIAFRADVPEMLP